MHRCDTVTHFIWSMDFHGWRSTNSPASQEIVKNRRRGVTPSGARGRRK
jgi:hypothetical protein